RPMSIVLAELLRHKTWATLALIEHCRSLRDDALAATVAGTYGTVHDTLCHLVEADENYYSLLTTGDPDPAKEDADASLGGLAERVRRLAPAWENLTADAALHTRAITAVDGWWMLGAIP